MYAQNNCMYLHGVVMGQHPTPSRFSVPETVKRVKIIFLEKQLMKLKLLQT